ncbi:MAG TPA: hypothetical protein VLE99_06040 [Candidatus Saccharimonadales bacterium]|nr:hypothetical protein [Candidatus Saccharimonadales bacterium]
MKSLRFLDRRAGYSLGALGLLLGMVAPSVLPAFASAAQLSSRSVEMGSSAVSATTDYTVKFTTTAAMDALILEFCDDSPIPGQTCTAPTGFDLTSTSLTGAGSDSGSSINAPGTAANRLEIYDTQASSFSSTLILHNVVNPSYVTDTTAHHGFYARIITYDTTAHADAYSSPTVGTGAEDTGGAAMAITNTIGVTATVRETMTFCVAGNVSMNASGPSGNCGVDANGGSATGLDTTHINLTLGHGTPAALDAGTVDTASDWAQLSTNASSGATVRMTNTNSGTCNGLFRTGASSCEIAGIGAAAALNAGSGKFGLLLGSSTSAPFSVATPTGAINPLAPYTGASGNYGMGSNVTTTYGDPIFDTSSAPISNKNVKLTFAATAAPTTPAGIYNATMNLIATGIY